MRLLVTRPEPDATRTAAALRAKGHDVLVAPMLAFEPIRGVAIGPGPWAGLLLTSANAARALARHAEFPSLKDLPMLAVGDRSAETARELGFTDVTSAAGTASDLARAAVARFRDAQAALLYAAAEDRAVDVERIIVSEGPPVHTVVVYRMAEAAGLPSNVADALRGGEVDGVLHYSRRSAEAYVDSTASVHQAPFDPTHYCLSAEVAKPLIAAGTDRIRIALRPDEGALFDLLSMN